VDRRKFIASLGAASFVGTAGCGANDGERSEKAPTGEEQPTEKHEEVPTDEPTQTESTPRGQRDDQNRNQVPFRVGSGGFKRWNNGEYRSFDVQGVNLGMTKPGRFPGEAAISRAEYDRWLSAIGEIANVIRTYTIHPPAFYRALAAYNEDASEPLLLLQGTWVPTTDLIDAGDATEVSETTDTELGRTVDVIHGQTTLEERPGHAAGEYNADVSDSTLGYLFGIEWPPEVVVETNEQASSDFSSGTYLHVDGASPFEQWLAGRMERLVTHEMDRYEVQRPVTFVNWVTTDPLDHPSEPFDNEDLVGIDPDHIQPTDAFEAGTLASYHVYPYYPDALNETPSYVEYTDHRGEPNNYAGYLNELVTSTDHPVLVAEFGVPSSRGIAHRNVHDRHQGRHTEQEQGEMVVAMFEDIFHADTAGGIMFAWQNEWFKRTWNLDARSVPSRRPFWSNVETPEQRFGLLGFEPVDSVLLDGSKTGWQSANTTEPSAVSDAPADRTLTRLHVTHDVEGLNFRLEFEYLPDPIDWSQLNVLVTVGLTGQQNRLPFGTDAETTADFMIRLAGPEDSRMLVESSYDVFAREFGQEAGLPLDSYRDGSSGFVPVRETINRGYTVPATGEQVPFEAVETGELRYGNGNPTSDRYDSLTDIHAAPSQNTIEGRLPWILLNVADPSSKQRIATDWDDGLGTVSFEGVSVSAATFIPDSDGDAAQTNGPTNLVHQIPGQDGSVLRATEYSWEPWNQPAYEERLKQSYHVLRRELK
jgi:hypothetical protein